MRIIKFMFILIVAVIAGCCTKYIISDEQIRSFHEDIFHVAVENIVVDSFDGKIPVKYNVAWQADLIIKDTLSGARKVQFYKPDSHYEWMSNSTITDTLPYPFENNNWYKFSGLMNLGDPHNLFYFLHIDSNGRKHIYRWIKPTNF